MGSGAKPVDSDAYLPKEQGARFLPFAGMERRGELGWPCWLLYLNFGRQLYKLGRQQQISGESFVMAAKVLLDKWEARGGDTSATRRSVDVSPSASARRNPDRGLRHRRAEALVPPLSRC